MSYSGGVFGIGALVTGPFTRALQAAGAHYDLRAPRFAPVIGAALYAAKCSGRPLDRQPRSSVYRRKRPPGRAAD